MSTSSDRRPRCGPSAVRGAAERKETDKCEPSGAPESADDVSDTLTPVRPPEPAPTPRPKRALTVLGLVVLAASAVFGADPAGIRERVLGSATAESRSAAVSRQANRSTDTTLGTATTRPAQTVLRSQPWWQGVTTLQGTVGGTLANYAVTANNFKSGPVTKPAAGWTAAEVNAVRFRFGGWGLCKVLANHCLGRPTVLPMPGESPGRRPIPRSRGESH